MCCVRSCMVSSTLSCLLTALLQASLPNLGSLCTDFSFCALLLLWVTSFHRGLESNMAANSALSTLTIHCSLTKPPAGCQPHARSVLWMESMSGWWSFSSTEAAKVLHEWRRMTIIGRRHLVMKFPNYILILRHHFRRSKIQSFQIVHPPKKYHCVC